MSHRLRGHRIATLATSLATLAILATPAYAASSASSAASSASDSIGSISNSLSTSSNSSTGDRKLAQGEYRIVEIQTEANAAGDETARLRLAGPQGDVELRLPQTVAIRNALGVGRTVTVAERTWGYQFTLDGRSEPFYLAVHTPWLDAFRNQPVAL
jgi:hypothetical protein